MTSKYSQQSCQATDKYRDAVEVRDPADEAIDSEWVIQCDFDGTISRQDVTDTLLEHYGLPGWEAFEKDWERGEIGSKECMRGQIALLEMSTADLHRCLDNIELDPSFLRFAEHAKRKNIEIQVVSDGLDYAIRYLFERAGITGLQIIANHLVKDNEHGWHLETPWENSVCPSANCKCLTYRKAHNAGKKVCYIGDGSSDYCVSERAELVLAKKKLIDYCQSRDIAFQPFNDFDQAWMAIEENVLNQSQELTV